MQNQSKIDAIFAGLIGKNSSFPAQFAPDMQVEITLRYARNSGARFAALQASPDGLNIYERMGFRALCTFRMHSNGST